MIDTLWGLFPRLIERNINSLLDEAVPNALKAFQIYKACQSGGLFKGDVHQFSGCLDEFYSRPRAERRKSHFDKYLEHPMDHELFKRFHLDFRCAVVDEGSLSNLASWAHNLIRVSKKTTSAFVSLEVMTRTLKKITTPTIFDKAQDIEFSDFCAAWKKTVFKILGTSHDREFEEIVSELEWLNGELKKSEARVLPPPPPALDLTQTELDWLVAVHLGALENSDVPKFPLSKGPGKQELKDLERVVALYTASRTSKHPEILKNQDNIRATVLDRCDVILGRKRAA